MRCKNKLRARLRPWLLSPSGLDPLLLITSGLGPLLLITSGLDPLLLITSGLDPLLLITSGFDPLLQVWGVHTSARELFMHCSVKKSIAPLKVVLLR